ncbi:MAG: hypothetical protein AABP62_04255, partial [Planctomycetota bacterium]
GGGAAAGGGGGAAAGGGGRAAAGGDGGAERRETELKAAIAELEKTIEDAPTKLAEFRNGLSKAVSVRDKAQKELTAATERDADATDVIDPLKKQLSEANATRDAEEAKLKAVEAEIQEEKKQKEENLLRIAKSKTQAGTQNN